MKNRCSFCKIDLKGFGRYAPIKEEGHIRFYGYLCDECFEDRKQQQLKIVDAPIPKPTPPDRDPPSGGPVISSYQMFENDLSDMIFSVGALKSWLMALEDFMIFSHPPHEQEGPSKPQAGDTVYEPDGLGLKSSAACSPEEEEE